MTVLHLMGGLSCSGKTTRARQLAAETGALVFTPGVWHLKLFGNDYPGPYHDRNHGSVEALTGNLAKKLLRKGISVVLDFGFWSRAERDDFKSRALRLGVACRIHDRDVPAEELLRRLERRNAENPPGTFAIPHAETEKYMALFEPPTAHELEP